MFFEEYFWALDSSLEVYYFGFKFKGSSLMLIRKL